jgi:hypothetical protein
MWGNTIIRLVICQPPEQSCTVKKLREQAMALLKEANKINNRDVIVQQELESHVETITRADLCQRIRKPR